MTKRLKQLLKCLSPWNYRQCMTDSIHDKDTKESVSIREKLKQTDTALDELKCKITELELTVNGDEYLFIKAGKKNG
ncbi:MAG: hypothetical protein KKD77_20850 [Gammaproteobacteria bacterium]|nr:hypothetical protein [Gammaproteobacteria bacterium]